MVLFKKALVVVKSKKETSSESLRFGDGFWSVNTEAVMFLKALK